MRIQARINIQQPLHVVFPLVSNVVNLPLYDKSIRSVKQITPGPIGERTTFHLIASQFGISMTVILEDLTYAPESYRFAYRVISGPFPVETRYDLRSFDGGTQLLGEREPFPQGGWNRLLPLLTIPARKKFETELNSLKKYIEEKNPS